MPLADGRALVSPVFVARDAAFDAFARVFDQVEEGRGQTVLLSGEAGVGKSRFVSEARAHAERAGSRFLEGNCFEPDRSLPFAPLVDALNTTMLPRTRATTLPILGPYAPELVKILPELGLWLPDARPTAPLDPQQEKRRVFRALVSFLLDLANDAPLLFTVEDVHWCDDTSLDFLRFLALHGRSSRLLVLLTARLDEPSPSLVGLVSELNRQRALVELSLRPLAPGEVSVMVGAIFSLERPPRPEFIDTLHSLTGGNPFFIEEVLRSLVESGSVAPADRGWARRALAELTIPRSIDDAVQLRIGLLGRRDRDTLALAAVAGRRIDLALLEALTGESEAELLATMETLVGAQLLVDFGDRFAFRHALTQQAVSARLPARRRKALHRMIGETIERLYASSLDKHLSELAYHFHQAEQWPQTLAYSRLLGDRALALYAAPEAVEQFTRALDAATHVAEVDTTPFLFGRGQAHHLLGDFEAALGDYEQTLDRTRRSQDRVAQWRTTVALGQLWTYRDYTRAGDLFGHAVELARQLGDPIQLAISQSHLANWLNNVGEPARATDLLRETVATFEHQGDIEGAAHALQALGEAAAQLGDRILAVSSMDRAIELSRRADNKIVLSVCLALRAALASPALTETTLSSGDPPARCEHDHDEAIRQADAIGWRAGHALADYLASWMFASFGRLGDALARARSALDVTMEVEQRLFSDGANASWGGVNLAALDHTRAIEVLETGLEQARGLGSAFYIGIMKASLAEAYLLAGDLRHCQAVLDSAVPDETAPHNLHERRLLWVMAQLALARHEADRALAVVDTLISTVPGEVSNGEQATVPGLAKLRGDALFALGRTDQAIGTLEDAKRAADEQGALPLLWQIHRSLARIHGAARHRGPARAERTAATQIIERMADSFHEPAGRDRFVAAAMSSLPTEQPLTALQSAKLAFGGLTRREREIAALIAHGKSTREIAAALVVSQRTVETHVTNMYAKLGFNSRAQIAAWAVEHDLADAPTPPDR